MKSKKRKKYKKKITQKYRNYRIERKYLNKKNKKKSRKRRKKYIQKTKKLRRQPANLNKNARGLWDDDAYMINVVDVFEEPVVIGFDGMDETERHQAKLKEWNDNFLRTAIIKWKRKVKGKSTKEPGWEMIYGSVPDEDNYIKYLLDEMPENITNVRNDNWSRADEVNLGNEASSILGELKNKTGKNYWIDPRLFGERWKGLFDKTSADHTIIEIALPM